MEDASNISSEIRAYLQEQLNQLRSEHLDSREKSLEHRSKHVAWWLTGLAIIFTFLTFIIGFMLFSEKKENEELKIKTERAIETLEKDTSDVLVSLVSRIRNGEYINVSLASFIPLAVVSEQVAREEITEFVDNAYEFFATKQNRLIDGEYDQEEYKQREFRIEGGGVIQISRTSNEQEFLAAWNGVLEVLQALKDGKNLPGIKILVRGTERFFDIKGIGGVGGRTWIAFDLQRF